MKILLGLLILAVSANFYADANEQHKMLHDMCVAETGVDEGLIVKANQGELVPDPKMKCYLKCLMINMGAMSEDGIVYEDKFISAIPEPYKSIWEGPIKSCGTKKGTCPCDNAYQTQLCYLQAAPEHYYLM